VGKLVSDRILSRDHPAVVSRERLFRFPGLAVEFLVGHAVGGETEAFFVEIKHAACIVIERVANFLVGGWFVHKYFSTNRLNSDRFGGVFVSC